MPHSFGMRARTRHMFRKGFKDHGSPNLSTFMVDYRVGDIVDIKANSSQQKGMPHKFYHGKTGIVYNVTARAVGVICYKVVNGRYLEKRVNIRVEHVKHSKCRKEFLDRVKSNAEKKKEAKATGEHISLKRLPAQPRESRQVSIKGNVPQTLTALPYETTI
ncbi:putative 60s ribosomal protein l21-a [Dioszegia hungarica]|uniref:60s ribosomal protein l21-a n=1 Tax=Dioszegia hungarica TaxID=4972 RepID=A0AA38LTW2_9TREE|nr:putative 60s ribosomal protein l21-a [Dioszegia hungarica]KAI9633061.1 putative 60s ribosomal protein l21-a [Dioszegia hungarica]